MGLILNFYIFNPRQTLFFFVISFKREVLMGWVNEYRCWRKHSRCSSTPALRKQLSAHIAYYNLLGCKCNNGWRLQQATFTTTHSCHGAMVEKTVVLNQVQQQLMKRYVKEWKTEGNGVRHAPHHWCHAYGRGATSNPRAGLIQHQRCCWWSVVNTR